MPYQVRGGGGARAGAAVPGAGASLSASTAEAVATPVTKYRKDYKPPGHWTRYVRQSGSALTLPRDIAESSVLVLCPQVKSLHFPSSSPIVRCTAARHVTLDINLGDGATVVTSELDLERNADLPGSDLFLDGEELKLFRVYVRGGDGKVAQLEVPM